MWTRAGLIVVGVAILLTVVAGCKPAGSRAKQAISEGKAAYRQGDYDKAVVHFTKAI